MISQRSVKSFRAILLVALCVGVLPCLAIAMTPVVEDHPADHATQAGGHEKQGPIDLKVDLGLWSIIVFVVLLIVLKKFAWGPIMEAVESREKHIHDSVKEAERARDEASRLLAEHSKKLAEVQNEVRAILDEARRDAQHTQQEIMKQAQAEAQATAERAKREIAQARDHALQQLFSQAADLATDVAARIVRRSLNPQDHRDLVQQALKDLPSQN
jgi:F-type H+-transporting ATPase subunit b